MFNAGVVHDVLGGAPGGVRDVVLLNAAAGIIAFDGLGADDPEQRFVDAVGQAADAVDSGAAATLLARWAVASVAASQPV